MIFGRLVGFDVFLGFHLVLFPGNGYFLRARRPACCELGGTTIWEDPGAEGEEPKPPTRHLEKLHKSTTDPTNLRETPRNAIFQRVS